MALVGLAAWAFTRQTTSAGPSVFDAALPDSAVMSFAATATSNYGTPLRNLSVSPDGAFAVYAAVQGDSTLLWYRSLRDASSRPIGGTIGATAPRISPDGSRVAYLVAGRVMLVSVDGGNNHKLFEGQSVEYLDWIAPTTLLVSDQDGTRFTWLDPEAGQTAEQVDQPLRFRQLDRGRSAAAVRSQWHRQRGRFRIR